MKYTIEDMNEDFDYLARKCGNFKNALLAQDIKESEENRDVNIKYFYELVDCFNSLEEKYSPYFPELNKNKSYVSCDNELSMVYVFLRVNDEFIEHPFIEFAPFSGME